MPKLVLQHYEIETTVSHFTLNDNHFAYLPYQVSTSCCRLIGVLTAVIHVTF